VIQFPITGWWFPLPAVGVGFLVYLLVRGRADESGAASGDFPLPGDDG